MFLIKSSLLTPFDLYQKKIGKYYFSQLKSLIIGHLQIVSVESLKFLKARVKNRARIKAQFLGKQVAAQVSPTCFSHSTSLVGTCTRLIIILVLPR
jgi:hypothetical protein